MENNQLAISVEELGRRMDLSRTKAYELSRREGFPTIRLGGRVLIPLAQLDAWIARQVNAEEV